MNKIVKMLVALAFLNAVAGAATMETKHLQLLLGTNGAEYNDYNDSANFSVLYTGGSATMTITGASLAITASDTDNSVSMDLSAAAYDTVGEVYDALVATSSLYTIVDIDMRRADNSNLLGDVSAQAVWSSAYEVLFDTAGTVCTGGLSEFTQIALTPTSGKRIRLFKVIGNADIASAAATDAIYVYKEAAGTCTETKVWQTSALTDSTDATLTFSPNPPYGGIDFAEDERVIIRTMGDEEQDTGAGTLITYMEW